MEHSANLQLPYIMPSQAQKHVTHNEAIRTLDSLVQLAVLERNLSTPPGSPADGARYLVAASGSAAWAGKDGMIAVWQDSAWAFLMPKAGWLLWVADEARLLGFDGAAWIDAAVHSVNPAPLVGVNATADATNRLTVRGPASLFDEEGGDHRLKINKATAGGTASLIFQSGYSGRAEFGLAGDDDWHVKVSPDGAVWTEALKVDRATGRVSLPAGLPLGDENQVVTQRHVRELLTANRTYYVRTDGLDSNSGLVNDSSGAFLTIQKAANVIFGTLDLGGFNVTVQIADGTYGAGVSVTAPQVGAGTILFQGNMGAPSNCLVSTVSASCFAANNAAVQFTIDGLELRTATVGNCVDASNGAAVTIGSSMNFGACATRHISASRGGTISVSSGYTISGDATNHFFADQGGIIFSNNDAFTLSGTPNFSNYFCRADGGGNVRITGATFSGAATGARYAVSGNAVVSTGGGGPGYLPGSSAGTAATGGQYLIGEYSRVRCLGGRCCPGYTVVVAGEETLR